jgi:hypothetical protein
MKTDYEPKTRFSDDVGMWYGDAYDEDVLNFVSTKSATRKNVLTLRGIVSEKGLERELEFIDKVMDLTYKSEFRYTYSQNRNMVSAASEMFSMLRQSMTWSRDYADKN